MLEISNDKRVDVLLHFETALREDWRFLHKSRVIVGAAFVAGATSILGWLAGKTATGVLPGDRVAARMAVIMLAVIGTMTLGWFGSSLNALKRRMVRVEEALHLFDEEDFYLPKSAILEESSRNWGEAWHGWVWGKSILTCSALAILFLVAVEFIT